MYYLLGVVSLGEEFCGSTDNGAVYTRVRDYIGWIEEKTKISFCKEPTKWFLFSRLNFMKSGNKHQHEVSRTQMSLEINTHPTREQILTSFTQLKCK